MGPTLALIHSPFVGASCWRAVAVELGARGKRAIAVDYGAVGPGDDQASVCGRIAECLTNEGDVVICVHSAAGALARTIADDGRASVVGTIFVDAILPTPSRSWLETAPAALARRLLDRAARGRLPPWS
ncbi:MAG: hypothetical protein ABI376_09595, partial [Caulobacteraceae bacterium]